MKNLFLAVLLLGILPTAISQNTGIGTTNPTRAKLEVIGVAGSGATNAAFGTDGPGISIQRNWPTIGFNQYRDNILPGTQGKYMANGPAALHFFDPNLGNMVVDMFPSGTANTYTPSSNTAIVISSGGNVGIRNSNPSASLTVGRGDGFEGTAVFQGSFYSSHFNYSPAEYTYIRAGSDNGNIYINQIPDGDVFFGDGSSKLVINHRTTSPPVHTVSLGWTGAHFFALIDEYNNRWSQRFDQNTITGDFWLDLRYGTTQMGYFLFTSGDYLATSDRRRKQNIRPLPGVLEKIKQLNPVSYEITRDNPAHKRTIGFIEKEVKDKFPNLVRVIDDHSLTIRNKELYTLNNSGIGVLTIKALQEQYQQIKDLEKEEEDLLIQIEELSRQIEKNSSK